MNTSTFINGYRITIDKEHGLVRLTNDGGYDYVEIPEDVFNGMVEWYGENSPSISSKTVS